MVHLSRGMKAPASPHLLSESAILAGMAQATLPESKTPWQDYVEDYDRIRDTMARGARRLRGLQPRVRQPLGFRLHQPARERVFLTPSGRAEFSTAPLPDVVPDWRTADAGDDALARPVEHHDLLERRPLPRPEEPAHARVHEPPTTCTSAAWRSSTSWTSRASPRTAAAAASTATAPSPTTSRRGSAAGYMPELNVLCAIGDFSEQSDQPLTKHLVVEIAASAAASS